MLKALIWFLLFYLVFRLIKNIFAPAKIINTSGQQGYTNPESKKEGKIVITDIPNHHARRQSKKEDDGEYIDYKEVK